MNRRIVTVGLFCFLFAGGASIVLYRVMLTRMGSTPAVATQQVLVAAKQLEAGRVVVEQDIASATWSGPLPAGVVLKKADVIGRSVSATIYDKELLVASRLATPGTGGGLAAFIPKGMRAVGVRVNEVVGVAGFVVPGSHVDVVASGQGIASDGSGGGAVTKTILQNIAVLSSGQDMKQSVDGKPMVAQVVNLLVTPREAEILSLAGTQTTIQLIMRNALDTEVAETPGATLAGLFTGMSRTVAEGPKRQPKSSETKVKQVPGLAMVSPRQVQEAMEIIHGVKRTEVTLTPGEPRGEAR